MAQGLITKRAVDAMKAGDRPSFLWDAGDRSTKGFGVKITPAGKRTYVFQYRMGGRASPTRRYTIGDHGSLTPDQARERAQDLAAMVRRKCDPIEDERERANTKAAAAASEAERVRQAQERAFSAYADLFIEKHMGQKAASSKVFARGVLQLHAKPVLLDKPVDEITRRDMVALFDRLPLDRPAVRRNVYSVLHKLFQWAKGREDVDANPLTNFEAPPPVQSRDRVLDDAELALAWRAADAMPYPFGPMYQALFATGQRREEVGGLDWSEVSRERALWTLPGERAKNGEANLVPLNALAIAALDRVAGIGGRDATKWPRKGLVFTTTGETPVSGYSKAKIALDAKMLELARSDAEESGEDPDAIAITPWRLHDARRTVATGLQRLGVRFEVTEAVLNHVSGSRSGIAGVYQRHGWGEEKRAALDAWGKHIERLLSPADDSNVIPIAEARA